MIDIRRTVIWVILLGSGGFLTGCRQGPPAPFVPQDTWEWVRYHEEAPEGWVDLVIWADGRVRFEDTRPSVQSQRHGLLSEATRETLDRLLADCPGDPVGTSPPPCDRGPRFFVSYERMGHVGSVAGSPCDPLQGPEGALVEVLQDFVQQINEDRLVAQGFDRLGQGRTALPQGIYAIRDLQDMLDLLARLSPDVPVLWPQVDFSREMVLGIVGDPSWEGVEVSGIALTEAGRLHLSYRAWLVTEPCGRTEGNPYDFVRLARHDTDLFVEQEILEVSCAQAGTWTSPAGSLPGADSQSLPGEPREGSPGDPR
jgi:hypothetical protein